jgi:hypothetical protein
MTRRDDSSSMGTPFHVRFGEGAGPVTYDT